MDYSVEKELIKIENLNFQIKDKKILRDVGNDRFPFVIHDLVFKNNTNCLGQVVAIVGRSGAGKSSLFRLLTGLVKPTSGKVLIPHASIPDKYKEVAEGEVGFVQQNYPLSRNQSVISMLTQACKMGKISKTDSTDLVKKYLNDWGLFNQRNQYTNQLSGGQRQRVAIIEQLLCSHHFMVFDEPFSGLDVGNIMEVKASFRKIADQDNINTIVFSTHDIDLAVEIADLIYVVGFEKNAQGEIIEGGTIVDCIDLKKLGLAWKPYCPEHKELSNRICEKMLLAG